MCLSPFPQPFVKHQERPLMRRIGRFPSESQACKFEAYLLTLGIRGLVEEDAASWTIWVHDEDHVEQAKHSFTAFTQAPDDACYSDVLQKATVLRKESEKEARKSFVDVRRQWQWPLMTRCPVVMAMIGISVLLAILFEIREENATLRNTLSIAPYRIDGKFMKWNGLQKVRDGQVWRLVTPIFMHAALNISRLGFLHILFNMLWLRDLGSAIELRRGSFRFVLLVLAIAIPSNLAQYSVSGPAFLGMSGIVFGLFGYVWMKSRFEPVSGFYMPPNLVVLMIGWFLVCAMGVVGNIANMAHGAGLAVGAFLGFAPTFWRNMLKH